MPGTVGAVEGERGDGNGMMAQGLSLDGSSVLQPTSCFLLGSHTGELAPSHFYISGFFHLLLGVR